MADLPWRPARGTVPFSSGGSVQYSPGANTCARLRQSNAPELSCGAKGELLNQTAWRRRQLQLLVRQPLSSGCICNRVRAFSRTTVRRNCCERESERCHAKKEAYGDAPFAKLGRDGQQIGAKRA